MMKDYPLERGKVLVHLDRFLGIDVKSELFLKTRDQDQMLHGIPPLQASGTRLIPDLVRRDLQESSKEISDFFFHS